MHEQAVAAWNVVEIKCVRRRDTGLDADMLDPYQDEKPARQIGKHRAAISSVPTETFGAIRFAPSPTAKCPTSIVRLAEKI